MSGKGLEDLVYMVRSAAPDLPAPTVRAIAARLQRDLGGGRIYFRKAPVEHKAQAIGSAIAAGNSLPEAFAVAGVSRTTGYRILKKRWVVIT